MKRKLALSMVLPLVATAGVVIGQTPSSVPNAVPPLPVAAAAESIPTPASVIGWEPCTDYKLADYDQLTQYYKALDTASSRMKLVSIGQTSEGREQYMGIISSEENLEPSKLARYQEISRKLSTAQDVSAEEAKALAAEGKAIAWVDYGIHSTEVGPTQSAPQFAYELITSETDEAKSIRDNVITLFVPDVNPDGTQKIADWYRKYLGTKFQDSRYPMLYNKYAGHDNNRDWFMFNLDETKNVGRQLFHNWFPQMVYNTHQTAAYPARIFLPPFKDPSNPNIPAEVMRGINQVGDQMTQRLDREGKVGAISRQQYDQWWNGGLRSVPAFHNMIGILSETAHASATPKYEDPTKFPETFPYQEVSTSQPSAFYPSPYKGGWWHLSDSCSYITTTAWALLRAADVDRENWLLGSWRMGTNGIAEGGDTTYVVPADQADLPTVVKFVNTLRFGQVQVEQARSDFRAGNRTYPAGSFIIREAQAYRANVVDLLNPQEYPDRRNPDGTPERPYDMAGWTLPMQMGVTVDKVEKAFIADTIAVDVADVPQFAVPEQSPEFAFAIDPRVNDSFSAVSALLKAGEEIQRTTAEVETSEGVWPAGTWLVKVRAGADKRVKAQAKKYGLTIAGVQSEPADATAVSQPRVGLYRGWSGSNYDEGWTRFVLEQFKLPYKAVKDKQVRAGNLIDSFDTIVLPDQSYQQIRDGLAEGTVPNAYAGGITEQGVANLKEFVEAGGNLVAVNEATQLPIQGFGLPVTDVTADLSSDEYYSPGSVVAGTVNADDPLAYGMPESVDLYSDHSPGFEVQADAPDGTSVVASYAAEDAVLRSGWLLGAENVAEKANVVRVPQGDGQVVLIGTSVQHRAQAHGTYKLLFNALYLP